MAANDRTRCNADVGVARLKDSSGSLALANDCFRRRGPGAASGPIPAVGRGANGRKHPAPFRADDAVTSWSQGHNRVMHSFCGKPGDDFGWFARKFL